FAAAPAWAGNVTTQPSGAGSPWTWTYPSSAGTSGYVLQTDGTGVTSWVSNAGTASTALSGITAAIGTASIDSTNKAITWQWGTLSTQTALSLVTSSMTTGTLFSLSNTSTPANAGKVLSVSNSQGGPSYGISSTMLSATNTGYAGYFSNATTQAGYGVYGTITGHNNS